MRVVVDTNVMVSSFFGGPPRAVIDLWRSGDITLCVSRALIDEYVEVLNRLALQKNLVQELLELWASGYHLLFTDSTRPLRIVRGDSDDDMLFECAVALEAKAIVTGDKAVRRVGRYMDIEVVTPAEFVARRSKAESPE